MTYGTHVDEVLFRRSTASHDRPASAGPAGSTSRRGRSRTRRINRGDQTLFMPSQGSTHVINRVNGTASTRSRHRAGSARPEALGGDLASPSINRQTDRQTENVVHLPSERGTEYSLQEVDSNSTRKSALHVADRNMLLVRSSSAGTNSNSNTALHFPPERGSNSSLHLSPARGANCGDSQTGKRVNKSENVPTNFLQ